MRLTRSKPVRSRAAVQASPCRRPGAFGQIGKPRRIESGRRSRKTDGAARWLAESARGRASATKDTTVRQPVQAFGRKNEVETCGLQLRISVQKPEIIMAMHCTLGRFEATAIRLQDGQIEGATAVEREQRRRERAETNLQDADRPVVGPHRLVLKQPHDKGAGFLERHIGDIVKIANCRRHDRFRRHDDGAVATNLLDKP